MESSRVRKGVQLVLEYLDVVASLRVAERQG